MNEGRRAIVISQFSRAFDFRLNDFYRFGRGRFEFPSSEGVVRLGIEGSYELGEGEIQQDEAHPSFSNFRVDFNFQFAEDMLRNREYGLILLDMALSLNLENQLENSPRPFLLDASIINRRIKQGYYGRLNQNAPVVDIYFGPISPEYERKMKELGIHMPQVSTENEDNFSRWIRNLDGGVKYSP